MRPTKFRVLGTAPYFHEAAERVPNPGDCVVVERSDVQRQLVLRCPDGCGEILPINLDRRAGPAWRFFNKDHRASLFPSIDRPTGCRSHFILSRGRIIWCDSRRWEGSDPILLEYRTSILRAVADGQWHNFVSLAEGLDAVPWDVLETCEILVRDRVLEEGDARLRGCFRLRATKYRTETGPSKGPR